MRLQKASNGAGKTDFDLRHQLAYGGGNCWEAARQRQRCLAHLLRNILAVTAIEASFISRRQHYRRDQ